MIRVINVSMWPVHNLNLAKDYTFIYWIDTVGPVLIIMLCFVLKHIELIWWNIKWERWLTATSYLQMNEGYVAKERLDSE